jgi:hypothetical protein
MAFRLHHKVGRLARLPPRQPSADGDPLYRLLQAGKGPGFPTVAAGRVFQRPADLGVKPGFPMLTIDLPVVDDAVAALQEEPLRRQLVTLAEVEPPRRHKGTKKGMVEENQNPSCVRVFGCNCSAL